MTKTPRMTLFQAFNNGLISKEEYKKQQCVKLGPAAIQLIKEQAEIEPQKILFNHLIKSFKGKVEWEKEGLVKGRNYRVDIYLPESKIAIEFDGFQHHRSLTAFKTDRLRQNLLALQNIMTLRFFNQQVMETNELSKCVAQIIALHCIRTPRSQSYA